MEVDLVMKKVLSLLLAVIALISCFSVSSSAADYATFDLVISDNDDGTVTVTAYAPAGAYSGKLVITNSTKLSYVADSASFPAGSIFNSEYSKNGISGICIVFAFSNELTEKTQVISLNYNVINDADISAADVYSEEWNLTDGTEFIANQNNGPISVSYVPKTYTVRFVDANDKLLKEETVLAGGDATPPVAPDMEGYEFVAWDADYTNVKSDITVKADYVIKMFTVTFTCDEYVEIVGSKTARVPYGTKFEELPFPDVDTPSSSIVNIGWEIQSGGYDAEKGVCADITVVVTYDLITGPELPDDDFKLGDVNIDGYVDNIDAAVILKYDAGLIDITDGLTYAGDVNLDGYIDNIDAALILKYDAGLIEGF